MAGFLLRRLGWTLATLFAVVTVAFFLMRAVRGGPFDSERALPPAVEEAVRARYHLDWPMWKQYAAYVGPFNLDEHASTVFGGDGTRVFGGVLAGDLGPSFKYRDLTVNDLLADSLPASMTLGVAALVVALAVGLPAGILGALKKDRALDVALRLVATAGLALPNFVIAGFLVLLLVFALPLFPVAGWGGAKELVLPAVVLGLPFAAYVARLSRTAMIEVLAQDWIRTARAKGLAERVVILRHALPSALLPVVSFLGPAAAGILTGSLVVERLFAIPGCGAHFVNGALNRDYTLAMGVTIVYTALVSLLNLAVDVVYGWIDPRLSAGSRG